MTNEYRKTEEYKVLMSQISEEHPTLPMYLCEMAIVFHKNFPTYHKQAIKDEKKNKKNSEAPPPTPILGGDVKVYDADDPELKKAKPLHESWNNGDIVQVPLSDR